MTISAAKLEANRRNAEKSTGPKSERGKQRSSLNAVTHGLRAEALILRDEDPAELEARREAWTASLVPRDEAERRAVEDAVVYSWRQDRARRAEVALANARLADDEAGSDTTVKEQVIELGQRLFLDRLGPIEFYPTGIDDPEFIDRDPSTSFAGTGKQSPDEPAILVLRLQSTLEGCEWILGEWAKLKRALDRGQPWLPSDKLKAVRLLGKQPVDAIDDEDVALVFLAAFVLKPDRGKWYWEISMELNENDTRRFRNDAATRQLECLLKPADAAAAKEALMTLIERVTKPLEAKAEAYRKRARIKTSLAADLLAFDPSVEAERMRRHELTSGRAMARSLDTLFKLRRNSGTGPLTVVSGPLSVVSGTAEAMTEAIAPNEPAVGWENAPNEPAVGWENVPNEPTGEGLKEDGRLTRADGACENATNEPTAGALSVVTGRLPVVSGNVEGVGVPNVTNEPTGRGENVTNEPTDPLKKAPTESELASDCEDAEWIEAGAGTDDEDNEDFESPRTYEEELGAQMRQALAKRKSMRMHELVELVEERRKAVEQIMADRRAQRRQERTQNGKRGGGPEGQAACTGQGNRRENPARKKTELDELLKTVSAVFDEANPVPS